MDYEILPTFETDSPAWHEQRRTGVGASQVAGVLNISPWATPLSVYRYVHGETQTIPENLAHFGHALEPVIADWVAKYHPELGEVGNGFSARSTRWPWLTATLDRTVGGVPLELKTASVRSRDDHWRDGVPVYYQAQLQAQIAVTGATHGYIACLFGGNDAQLWRFDRDDRFIDNALIPVTETFWVEHVQAGVPPEPTTLDELASEYPHDPGTVLVGSDTVVDAVGRRAILLADMKAMQEEADALTLTIGQYMGTAETLISPEGEPLVTYKLQKGRSYVNVRDLQEHHPDVAASMVREGKPFKVMRAASKKKGTTSE